MSVTNGPTATRALAAVHLTQGALLIVWADAVRRAVAGHGSAPPRWIVRGLGARTLAQGAGEAIHPSTTMRRGGAAVDLAHASTMLAAAGMWPHYRRPAFVSAVAAVSSATAALLIDHAARRPASGKE